MKIRCPSVSPEDQKIERDLAKWRVGSGSVAQNTAISCGRGLMFGKIKRDKHGLKWSAVYLHSETIGYICKTPDGDCFFTDDLMKRLGLTCYWAMDSFASLDRMAMLVKRHLGLRDWPGDIVAEMMGNAFIKIDLVKSMTSRPSEWNFLLPPWHRRAYYWGKRLWNKKLTTS